MIHMKNLVQLWGMGGGGREKNDLSDKFSYSAKRIVAKQVSEFSIINKLLVIQPSTDL